MLNYEHFQRDLERQNELYEKQKRIKIILENYIKHDEDEKEYNEMLESLVNDIMGVIISK